MKKSEPRDTFQGGTMNMHKKAFILGLAVLAAAMWAAPSFAAQAINGAVGEVSNADGPALSCLGANCCTQPTCVGFRIWSAFSGGATPTTTINANTASC